MPDPQSQPSPPDQQFDRSNDPAEAREMDRHAAELAMVSEHQAFAGRARHVGGVEFDDPGVYEITDPEVDPDALGPYAEPPPRTAVQAPSAAQEIEAMTAETSKPREADRASARREWKGDRTDEGPDELYNPTEVSSSRMRQQGLGMGEEELRLQRDPAREHHVREEMPGGEPPPPEPRKRRETRQ